MCYTGSNVNRSLGHIGQNQSTDGQKVTQLDPQTLDHWRERLHHLGLTPFVGVCLDVLEPFGPFAAQVLWVAQPTLNLFSLGERADAWAQVLEAPQGVAWLRQELVEQLHDDS